MASISRGGSGRQALEGLGMNVARAPAARARARTAYFSRKASSAAVSGSAWWMLISSWPGPYSLVTASTGT